MRLFDRWQRLGRRWRLAMEKADDATFAGEIELERGAIVRIYGVCQLHVRVACGHIRLVDSRAGRVVPLSSGGSFRFAGDARLILRARERTTIVMRTPTTSQRPQRVEMIRSRGARPTLLFGARPPLLRKLGETTLQLSRLLQLKSRS